MIDGDAYLPVTTNPAYVTATMPDDGSSVFPTALVVDEARGINWEGGAASFIDGLASDYSDMQVTLADGETPVPFGVEEFSQTSGSRQLVVHMGIPSLSASTITDSINNSVFWTIGEEVIFTTRFPAAHRSKNFKMGPKLVYVGGK